MPKSIQAADPPNAEVSAGSDVPTFAVGSNVSQEAIDQINQFLLEEQAELAKHRLRASEEAQEIASSNAEVPAEQSEREPLSLERVASTEVEVQANSTPSEQAPEVTVVQPTPEPSAELLAVEVDEVDVLTPWIRSLMESAAQSDAPMRQHLALAVVLALSAPEQAFQPAGLSELTDEEQELLSMVYERFGVLRKDLDEGADASSSLQAALSELIVSVQKEDPFHVSRMEFCSWVRDFGDVDVIDPPMFAPKERPRFIWYVELAGIDPVEDPKSGSWFYEFTVRLEVLTRDTGIPVIAPVEGKVRHSTSSRMQDLFLRDIFEVPSELQFDWYTVKLTVMDTQSGAQAQKSMDLLWVPNLAAGATLFQRQAAVNTEE